MNSNICYLDGNTAAGELSKKYEIDGTAAEGQCASCGVTKRFAEAHVYMEGPGLVARCAACEHVLLRLVNAPHHAVGHAGYDVLQILRTRGRGVRPIKAVPATGTEMDRTEYQYADTR